MIPKMVRVIKKKGSNVHYPLKHKINSLSTFKIVVEFNAEFYKVELPRPDRLLDKILH